MTHEEFKKIKEEVLEEIKKEQYSSDKYNLGCSIMIRGAMKLAMAVEQKFKEKENETA